VSVGRVVVWPLIVLGVVLTSACGDDDDGGETETAAPETGEIDPVRRHKAEKIAPHQLEELTRLAGRVREVQGAVTLNGEPMTAEDPFEAGGVIRTEADGKVVVDLVREMRVEIGASTHVTRGALREGELFLHRGAVRAELPPVGGSSRPPLRVGTPSGVVSLGGAGNLLIAVLPSGDVWAVAFSGAAELTRGEVAGDEGERRLAKTTLLEGEARVLGRGSIADATEAPDRVTGGWTAAAQLIEGTAALPAADARGLAEAAGERFDEAAGWLAAELERGAALAAEQREVAQSDPARARELTREIVVHSQRRSRLKQLALSRWDQLAAVEGFAGIEPSSERAERATELLSE
jgi:hypothetical protein